MKENSCPVETLCYKCTAGCTLEADRYGDAVTWCASDKFEERPGYNTFPEIKECEEFHPLKTDNDTGTLFIG